MNITQIHPSNDTLNFTWFKIEENIPLEWEAKICDNSFCYNSLINNGVTLPVLPGDDGFLIIHCTPHITSGTGVIRYGIFENENPANIDTLTWIINCEELNIKENSLANYIEVINNKIRLRSSDLPFISIDLFDSKGIKLLDDRLLDGNGIEIIDFPIGEYIIFINNLNRIEKITIWKHD